MSDRTDEDRAADRPDGAGWSTDGLGYLQEKVVRQRVFVVHPYVRGRDEGPHKRTPEARLDEAMGLAEAIDVDLLGGEVIPLRSLTPRTFIGEGRLEDLRERVEAEEIDLVIFDCELSPGQQRNLERAIKAKVIDRTALILEIFGARASTKEGELQVELAHLEYQKSRLVRSWTHLERQRGGSGFMGGPGETQIEADRRIIADRITRIKRQLEQVTRTRGLHRARRQKAPYPIIALVGYTNAGKSTLFNYLTRAEVLAEDMLFATLDPTMRAVILPSGKKIILSDTVGFISELPTTLVAAFRATLEEVLEANIIVHVRDASHPDTDIQKTDVELVLKDLGVELAEDGEGTPVIEAMNKTDLLDEEAKTGLLNLDKRQERMVAISGLTGEGCDRLLDAIDIVLSRQDETIELLVPYADGGTQSWIHANTKVLSSEAGEEGMTFKFTVDPVAWSKFQSRR
ncbi:GTPase HflX [Kordiimonas marina]|uniref:GTPase HflX n=1 Tax=Kordiimonas marina TaxID=2872312 RepID=UPI001FF40F6B|nr:GTPase HflX [Kordiimonas marina]MCJ9428801.1 GTPase HflX [Kordiimonas marina]